MGDTLLIPKTITHPDPSTAVYSLPHNQYGEATLVFILTAVVHKHSYVLYLYRADWIAYITIQRTDEYL